MQRPLGRSSPLMEDEDLIRRRKIAAEKRVQERHRALLAEQKQKNRTVAEERQRLLAERREREAREMKKRQEELHHHLEWLERDKARKKEILERQHAATSRTAKKDGVGFGSSTPRELSYLNHLPKSQKAYDKKLSPPPEPRLTPTKTPTPPKRTSMMTTSMYVPSSTPRRPPPSKVQAPPPKTKPTQNLMTQSVYTPSRAVGMTASAPRATLRSSPGARLPPAKQRALPKPAAQEKAGRQISTVRESPVPSPRSARSEKAERPAVPEINVKSSPLEETKITETTVSSEKSKPPKIEEPEVVKLVEFHEEESIHSMDEASDLDSVIVPKKEEIREEKEVEAMENHGEEIHQKEEPKETEKPVEQKHEEEEELLVVESVKEHKNPSEEAEEPKSDENEQLIDLGESQPQETQKSVIFTMESTEIEPLEHFENGFEEVKEAPKKEEHRSLFEETRGLEEFTLPGAVPEDYSHKGDPGISLADELSFAMSGEKPESVDESKLITSRPPSPPVATKNEEVEEIQRRREADQKHNDEVKARFAAVKARIGRVSPPNTKAEGLPPPIPVAAPAVDNGKPLSDSTAALLSRLSKMGALKSTKAAESVESLLTRHSSDPKIDNAPDDPVSLI